jgi:predicted negative regulator of RcsB-dependent stress response
VKLTGTNLNNLFTVLVFILVCLIAWVLWGHTGDAKEASKFLAEAIKDQTQATREQNVRLHDAADGRHSGAMQTHLQVA